MKEIEAINLLRHAMACIWTEFEKEDPDIDGIQRIANESLGRTKEFATGKVIDDKVGIDAWNFGE